MPGSEDCLGHLAAAEHFIVLAKTREKAGRIPQNGKPSASVYAES